LITRKTLAVVAAALITVAAATHVSTQQTSGDEKSVREVLVEQALRLRSFVRSEIANDFLDAVPELPSIEGIRIVYRNRETRHAVSEAEAETMSAEDLKGYERMELNEDFYYFTAYGSPLAFVRPLDLIGRAGVASLDGLRIADFGFGSIGQLRLMAANGASAHGIDVDLLLKHLYSGVGDTGHVPRAKSAGGGDEGDVAIHIGQWPAEESLIKEVGGGYDVFISKNTLKNGYIHPAEDIDARLLVHLGVDDEAFVAAVYRVLKPGGYFMIYNLCPKQPDDRYIPWADGRSPFTRELLASAGFNVVYHNADDSGPARQMGKLLGWGEHMELETDLYGTFTLMRK
jgi:SAM-dependent methyltransferase